MKLARWIAGVLVTTGIALIAVSYYGTTVSLSKQKRSIADIRTVATVLEHYAKDHQVYPDANTVAALKPWVVPKYVTSRSFRAQDGWAHDLRYECWPSGRCESYAIGSAGKDRQFEHRALRDYTLTKTKNFDCDIVLVNGVFVQYPAGMTAAD